MGASMASNLQAAGHARRPARRAEAAAAPHVPRRGLKDTPRAVAEAAEVVFTSLPARPRSSRWRRPEGLLHGIRAGSAVFDLSTNAPRWCGNSTVSSRRAGPTCSTRR